MSKKSNEKQAQVHYIYATRTLCGKKPAGTGVNKTNGDDAGRKVTCKVCRSVLGLTSTPLVLAITESGGCEAAEGRQ